MIKMGFPYKLDHRGSLMKRKRFTEEQIISILKENGAGISVPDLALRHCFAEGMFYTWRSKFGGSVGKVFAFIYLHWVARLRLN